VILDATHEQLAQLGLRIGQRPSLQTGAGTHEARYARASADVADGELLLYEDAQCMAAPAVNRGSAAELLKLARGTTLLLSR
jgi:S-adenosylmethionine hydrolase